MVDGTFLASIVYNLKNNEQYVDLQGWCSNSVVKTPLKRKRTASLRGWFFILVRKKSIIRINN